MYSIHIYYICVNIIGIYGANTPFPSVPIRIIKNTVISEDLSSKDRFWMQRRDRDVSSISLYTIQNLYTKKPCKTSK